MRASDLLSPHETWNIIDASKLNTYMACPRKYFFEFVLGWRPVAPNNHFVFGSAWHAALEHLLLNNYTEESLIQAGEIFFNKYRQELPPETDDMYGVKNPSNGLSGLVHYYHRFKNDPEKYAVIQTEVGGKVKLGDDAILVFRIDLIREDRDTGQIEVVDHKSSQRRINGWERLPWLSFQLMSYMHAVMSVWDFNQIKGGRIRCTFFYKNRYEFEEVLVHKSPEDMQSFLTDMLTYFDLLRRDMYLLMETCDDDEISMPAFPRNPNRCYDYGKVCEYFDICEAWPNPLRECGHPPEGFKVERWNPLSDPRLRADLDLTQEVETARSELS